MLRLLSANVFLVTNDLIQVKMFCFETIIAQTNVSLKVYCCFFVITTKLN